MYQIKSYQCHTILLLWPQLHQQLLEDQKNIAYWQFWLVRCLVEIEEANMNTFFSIISFWIFRYDSPFYITGLHKSNPVKLKFNHFIIGGVKMATIIRVGTKRNYSNLYQESLHKKLPFYTQLLFVNLVPELSQQQCPQSHWGPHLSSLSIPTMAIKLGKHKLRAKQ